MRKLEINLSDKDYSLLNRIAKSEGRRLSDLTYLLVGKGLDLFFCETLVHIDKEPDEYSSKDLEQMKKNAELENSEELGKCHDPLIEPLAERIESYATEPIGESYVTKKAEVK